ncbi:dihydroorotate dehydrogenase (quinone), mitochondrial-like isoform X1 [Penaeus chinensis]|uniref:dihydroorotate dehydrogenase (quinone), mitochondrial-like isoform X1 n=2 Tax=Penaeus chinensis TaxID=139456 RepID=UPI001FB7E24D|nr:dihydroorotate dehydrogenase (quinone), mitochondrial-like isoform X1 [Penaeus chinensis]
MLQTLLLRSRAAAFVKSLRTPVLKKKVSDVIKLSIGGTVVFVGINLYFKNEKFYDTWVMPIFHSVDPETAHNLAVMAAKYNLVPEAKLKESKLLESRVVNLVFKTPVGLAAGFDKHGEAVEGLFRMGFSFVEVGSVTPLPQPGNPKPRVFRLKDDKAVINRYGFNSVGHEVVHARLSQLQPPGQRPGILGINLGKNKTSEDYVQDYTQGIASFGPIADYLVVNISSPNTPGLRNLQHRGKLEKLVDAVVDARDNLPGPHKPPIFLKIAPDLTDEDKLDIAAVVRRKGRQVDGLIISNTTISRPHTLQSAECEETGGLSGLPLRALATKTIKDMYQLVEGSVPIIGVGGIASGQDAYDKIRAGASLVQLYTALIYHGPPLITRITRELEELLIRDGFKSVSEAVGVDCK